MDSIKSSKDNHEVEKRFIESDNAFKLKKHKHNHAQDNGHVNEHNDAHDDGHGHGRGDGLAHGHAHDHAHDHAHQRPDTNLSDDGVKEDHPFIKELMNGYFTSCRTISEDSSNFQLIHDIIYKLQNTRIPCYKYANTWDWHKCDESLVSIS
jgi:hypothetical protein